MGKTKAMLEQALEGARAKQRVLIFCGASTRQEPYMRDLLNHLGATAEDQRYVRFSEPNARLLRGTTKRQLLALFDHTCSEGSKSELEWSRFSNAREAAMVRTEGAGPWVDDPASGRPWTQADARWVEQNIKPRVK